MNVYTHRAHMYMCIYVYIHDDVCTYIGGGIFFYGPTELVRCERDAADTAFLVALCLSPTRTLKWEEEIYVTATSAFCQMALGSFYLLPSSRRLYTQLFMYVYTLIYTDASRISLLYYNIYKKYSIYIKCLIHMQRAKCVGKRSVAQQEVTFAELSLIIIVEFHL